MNEGDKVKMTSFKGRKYALNPVNPESLYELLIRSTGTIVHDPDESAIFASFTQEKRILVRFDTDLNQLGLHNRSNVPNSLWILESDLELL